MNVFDQATRSAARLDTEAVPRRLLAGTGLPLTFRDWYDTRSLPLPGGTDRTADLVPALDDPAAPERPWLMVIEFQTEHDPEKLEVTLEEVAVLRGRARHGPDALGRYQVIAGLVYLRGSCPVSVLGMRTPGGQGTRHEALVWNVAADDAAAKLDEVADGRSSWGMLFWIPLMAGGGEEGVIARWKEVVAARVPERARRGELAGIALIFAEVSGRVPEWRRGLEGFDMTESQVVNGWIREGEIKGVLGERRRNLLETLEDRFPGRMTDDVRRMIQQQESLDLLGDWNRAARRVSGYDDFLGVLRG